jgi:hypothetical protein
MELLVLPHASPGAAAGAGCRRAAAVAAATSSTPAAAAAAADWYSCCDMGGKGAPHELHVGRGACMPTLLLVPPKGPSAAASC